MKGNENPVGPEKNPRPALKNLDQKLERYLSFRNGFFIEAGANDGYSQSNTYFLETELNWRGILVEGIPELYAKCEKERPGSFVYHCALVSSDFKGRMATMHYANLMSVVDGALKTDEAQASQIQAGVNVQRLKGTYSIEVPARTLESILDEIENLPTIDFLSLDVEGYERNVLMGLNLSRFRPTYILVEARFFEEVNSLLVLEKYELLERLSPHDYLYRALPQSH